MEMSLELQPGDRDAVLLALAMLSLDRPVWREYLGWLADKFGPGGRDTIEMMRELHAAGRGGSEELRVALEESVKLQSHYATLLNMHDGGERRPFADAAAWIARLRQTGTLPPAGTS